MNLSRRAFFSAPVALPALAAAAASAGLAEPEAPATVVGGGWSGLVGYDRVSVLHSDPEAREMYESIIGAGLDLKVYLDGSPVDRCESACISRGEVICITPRLDPVTRQFGRDVRRGRVEFFVRPRKFATGGLVGWGGGGGIRFGEACLEHTIKIRV